MIVKPFETDVILTHKGFFILSDLPKFATEVDIWIQTPAGNESVDFIDVFCLTDGTLIAAWKHPFYHTSLHNLLAFCDGVTQLLNLTLLESIIDIYDRPLDADLGTYTFTKSIPIDGGDWRCDRGMYGAKAFEQENIPRVLDDIGQIVTYESILNVNGVAHLMYMEATNKSAFALDKINNSVAPTTGRTIQETLRLIYEWSLLAEEPFNSTEEVALSAKTFLSSLKFTDVERSSLATLAPMQISNYLAGSEIARVRPDIISELTDDIKEVVFKRMSASSLSALLEIHGIEDTYGLVNVEKQELIDGIKRFKEYFEIPEDWELTDEAHIIEHCTSTIDPTVGPYVHNQLRLFKNKKQVLDEIPRS